MSAIKNYYDIIPSSMKKKYHNPHFESHRINIPFRMLVVAQSGGGKTNFLLELIHRMSDTFERIFICCKSKDEPLYEYLANSIPAPSLMFFEGIKDVPKLESLESKLRSDEQLLVAFDDLVTEKDQKVIEDYFIRSRKVAGGVSCVYLSQSYFKVPKIIRLQCNYLVLKKLSSVKDLSMILRDFSLCDKKVLLDMYNKALSVPNSFLMIDVDKCEYREGFNNIFNTTVIQDRTNHPVQNTETKSDLGLLTLNELRIIARKMNIGTTTEIRRLKKAELIDILSS